jgi:hypothetical protein
MPAMEMLHEVDPKQAILDKVKEVLPQIDVFGSDCLVAIYRRPQRTKSGLWISDATAEEDRYQGKVGLLLKLGPYAFTDEDGSKFRDIEEFQWVAIRPSDGWPIALNSMQSNISRDNTIDCRVVTDINIRCRVAHPDLVY